MNGRLERMDCLELHCEANYSAVDYTLREERIRRRKRLAEKLFAFACWVGYCWLMIWRLFW